MKDWLCLAALFSFWDGMAAHMDSGEKQLVCILTLPRPLTQVSKCIFVSTPWNYALALYLDGIPAEFEGSGQRFEA